MRHIVNVKWLENMAFETEVNRHKLVLDTTPEFGGEDHGPRPKQLMLVALAGCTGMDVISILKKMRIEPEYFNVRVEGEVSEKHPKKYLAMKVIYELKGKNLDLEKIKKAVSMSEEKYCGVRAVYKDAMQLSSEIKILD